MPIAETAVPMLQGMYRDVLRGPDGTVLWDRGWCKNAIVADCRRLLAGLMHGPPTAAAGIQGLRVGAGQAAWDATPPPPPDGTETALVDPNPFLATGGALAFTYLDAGTPTANPTNRLQIVVTLGPNMPPWPDANHTTGNLREFGLVGQLDGTPVLINYVRHPVIAKDPTSTLERTIWLVF